MRYRTWPNAISLLRLPLAALFVVVESTLWRGVILVAGALSDFIDGWIARHAAGQGSQSGEILDGVTDKLFILVVLGTFLAEGRLEIWELLVLLIRDLYTAGAFFVVLALQLRIRFRSRWSGKVVTTLQLAAVVVLLVWPAWADPLILATGAAGLWAVVDYTRAGLASLRESARRP